MTKELKALETLKECKWHSSKEWIENYPIVEKSLKALEIIKDKQKIYAEHLGGGDLVVMNLDEEEFDFLKEVLL